MMTWGANKTVRSVRSVTVNDRSGKQTPARAVASTEGSGLDAGFFPLVFRMMRWSRVWRDRINEADIEEKEEDEQEKEEEEETKEEEKNDEEAEKEAKEKSGEDEQQPDKSSLNGPAPETEGKRIRCDALHTLQCADIITRDIKIPVRYIYM